jgi:hypothetical protein
LFVEAYTILAANQAHPTKDNHHLSNKCDTQWCTPSKVSLPREPKQMMHESVQVIYDINMFSNPLNPHQVQIYININSFLGLPSQHEQTETPIQTPRPQTILNTISTFF